MKRVISIFSTFTAGYIFLYVAVTVYANHAGIPLKTFDSLPGWSCFLGAIFTAVSLIVEFANADSTLNQAIKDREFAEKQARESDRMISHLKMQISETAENYRAQIGKYAEANLALRRSEKEAFRYEREQRGTQILDRDETPKQ